MNPVEHRRFDPLPALGWGRISLQLSLARASARWVLAMRLQAVSTALWLRVRKTVETVSIFSAHDSPG